MSEVKNAHSDHITFPPLPPTQEFPWDPNDDAQDNLTSLNPSVYTSDTFLNTGEIVLAVFFIFIGVMLIVLSTWLSRRLNSKEARFEKKIDAMNANGEIRTLDFQPSEDSLFSTASLMDISTLRIPPLMRPKNRAEKKQVPTRREKHSNKIPGQSGEKPEDTVSKPGVLTTKSPFIQAIKNRVIPSGNSKSKSRSKSKERKTRTKSKEKSLETKKKSSRRQKSNKQNSNKQNSISPTDNVPTEKTAEAPIIDETNVEIPSATQ